MKPLILLCLALATHTLHAAGPANAMVSIRSSSRQFSAHGIPVKTSQSALGGSTLRLDPALLTVTCERVKSALLRELNLPDRWRGKIQLVTQFTTAKNRPIQIDSTYYQEGWRYRVDLPDEVETNKLVRAITHVLLLEIANRQAGPRSTEVPLWLTEGLTAHLLAASGGDIVLQPFTRTLRKEYRIDPLRQARARWSQNAPLSFNELSQPTPGTLRDESWDRYKLSSHLFVVELLNLPGGRQGVSTFLQLLPQYLNWQFAFLRAFQPYFGSLLDVEKWWALTLARIEGDQLWSGWSRPEVWRRWDDLLQVRVHVSQTNARLPAPSTISLQRMIELYEFPVQKDVLLARIQQLNILRQRASPKVTPIVEGYLATLQTYLRKHEEAGYEPTIKGLPTPRPHLLIQDTIAKLDALDYRREFLRRLLIGAPPPEPPKPAAPVRSPKAT